MCIIYDREIQSVCVIQPNPNLSSSRSRGLRIRSLPLSADHPDYPHQSGTPLLLPIFQRASTSFTAFVQTCSRSRAPYHDPNRVSESLLEPAFRGGPHVFRDFARE